MKKLRLQLLLSFMFVLGANAQTNTFPSSGNVGIGTTNPSHKLQVVGNIYGTEYISVNKNGSFRVVMNGQAHGYIVGRNDNVEGKFQIHSNGSTWFNGGNVGIGTNSPQHKLVVNGGTSSIGDGGSGIPFKMWAGSSGGNNHLRIGTDIGHYRDAALEIYQNYSGGNEQNPGKVIVNGNMGIGTKNPDSKLTVKGKIHAEEVKVDLSVPGPDYVFKEGYDLRTLEETQDYIKEHGHLPNIPSAREMEENGIQLGKMNMKLLEKIEELTLYTLQQQQQINSYQEDIMLLNTKMEALEQQINNLNN